MKRKNLLITTIGRTECIPSWLTEDRSFDVALIYYPEKIDENTKNLLEKFSDYLFFESGFKYTVLKKVFSDHSELKNYDYFWMPDDDVKMVKGSVNALFDYALNYQLDLCQPSTSKENISWKIVRHNRLCELRYTSFVEVMCPLFSKKGLEVSLDSFSYTNSGWGLDFYWCKLLAGKVAIIDQVKVYHSKKIEIEGGKLYQKLLKETGKEPHTELDEMIEKYSIDPVPKEIARIYKRGSLLYYFYHYLLKKEVVKINN